MSGTGLESAVSIGDGAAGIVVEMSFDIARNDTTESADKVIYLSWTCATDCVCNTDSVHANFVDSTIDGEKVDEVRTEGIFG